MTTCDVRGCIKVAQRTYRFWVADRMTGENPVAHWCHEHGDSFAEISGDHARRWFPVQDSRLTDKLPIAASVPQPPRVTGEMIVAMLHDPRVTKEEEMGSIYVNQIVETSSEVIVDGWLDTDVMAEVLNELLEKQ